jgi:hypothetical protein
MEEESDRITPGGGHEGSGFGVSPVPIRDLQEGGRGVNLIFPFEDRRGHGWLADVILMASTRGVVVESIGEGIDQDRFRLTSDQTFHKHRQVGIL